MENFSMTWGALLEISLVLTAGILLVLSGIIGSSLKDRIIRARRRRKGLPENDSYKCDSNPELHLACQASRRAEEKYDQFITRSRQRA